MIEKTIYDYLSARVPSEENPVGVYMEIPAGGGTPPFVVIQKTGGGMVDGVVSQATLAIQSYGATLYEAAQVNELVKALMAQSVSLAEVARCRLNSDYNYTDTASKAYRYQAVFDIIHY